jgi:uncharacterized membrane protein
LFIINLSRIITLTIANKEIDKISNDQNDHLAKFLQIEKDKIVEEDIIIDNLLHPPKDILTHGQKVSDKIAQFGGSWKFIFIFAVFFAGWIIINIIALFSISFDPYPFVLMNLILSLIAAIQAPVILMSQNRHDEKDRSRDENDYMINQKAEMMIRSLHEKVNLMLEEQIRTILDSQAKQFTLLENIIKKLDQNKIVQ